MSKNMKIARRDFIKTWAAGVTMAALHPESMLAAPGKTKASSKKPNILLIMSDQHNASVAGFMGNKIVKTPNLDSLATQGITLENHYCNSPLCSPSRSSFTAGQYVSRTRNWGNESWLSSDDIPSIARMMTASGYDPVLCGKIHYDYTRHYGWQYFPATNNDFNNNYKRGLAKRLSPTDVSSDQLSPRFAQFHPGENGPSVRHDRKVTAGVLEFLSQRKADDKPFFLLAGYLAPHNPLIVPEAFDTYKDKVAMPDIPPGLIENLPTNYKNLRAGFEECNVPAETVKRGRELYYGLTSWIDNEIGKVLAQLRKNKEMAENTIIIYTSDHGENMAEHGMWWKNCMYDQATRVPTIISFPSRWAGGQRRTVVSSHVDLVKTIIDLGGGTTPTDWDGHSMVASLDNPKLPWKDFALSEYYAQFISTGYVMVRKGEWKYTYHTRYNAASEPERELYNMKTDPHELHNLAKDPAHKKHVGTMHALMLAELKKNPDETEQEARKELATGYRRKDPRPKSDGRGERGEDA
jgi:choline-sulfatase